MNECMQIGTTPFLLATAANGPASRGLEIERWISAAEGNGVRGCGRGGGGGSGGDGGGGGGGGGGDGRRDCGREEDGQWWWWW
jgi:hypothetical protein